MNRQSRPEIWDEVWAAATRPREKSNNSAKNRVDYGDPYGCGARHRRNGKAGEIERLA
jgi:hypothetical protein